MSDYIDGKALRKLILGKKVERASEALTNAATSLFTVAGGRVLMTGFIGEITVASAANACTWAHAPTTGTAQPIAASLDIDPALVGDCVTITGIASDAATYNASATGLPMMASPVILSEGDLQITPAAASGSMSWTMFYIPIDDGAYVSAA